MKIGKKIACFAALIATLAMTCSTVLASSSSDSTQLISTASKGVVALGADLSAEEKATVLSLMGLTEADLANYNVITVTNTEEHQYLDSYLTSDIIGTRALSSCKVEETSDGSGINVDVKNISYCTKQMYQNALATAGMKNANVVVAAPFEISGTAALVGSLKAYSEITGTPVAAEAIDSATNELVATSQVAENIGDQDKAAQLIAAAKEVVLSGGDTDEDSIGKTVDKLAGELGITLSDSDRTIIINLLVKLSKMNINVDNLKEQAPEIYQELKNNGIDLSQYGISEADVSGFLGFIQNLWAKIVEWFGSWA